MPPHERQASGPSPQNKGRARRLVSILLSFPYSMILGGIGTLRQAANCLLPAKHPPRKATSCTEHPSADKAKLAVAPAKRALLIGSSYKPPCELPGAEDDVNMMIDVLKNHGFAVEDECFVTTVCGSAATRERILNAWEKLISDTCNNDIVVIYYSGHGGLADPQTADVNQQVSRIQFMVPYDFDIKLETWKGILDSEISHLLREITRKTRNVTYILDCCHSARLGRRPGGKGRPKALMLKKSDHRKLLKHVEELRAAKRLFEDDNWSNPDVVRIAAAAADETAWEFPLGEGSAGALTAALAPLIRYPGGQASWRQIMLGVAAIVGRQFERDEKPQQPRSAGPDTRFPFTLERDESKAFLAIIDTDHTTIQGGRVQGIHQTDRYRLRPLQTSELQPDTGTATPVEEEIEIEVDEANGFSASAGEISDKSFPLGLAYASPVRRSHRWPIQFPGSLAGGDVWLHESGFFRECGQNESPLVEFQLLGDEVVLKSGTLQLGRRQITDHVCLQQAIGELFPYAEMLAQAQYLLKLEPGEGTEKFTPKVEIEIGLVVDRKRRKLAHYSEASWALETAYLADNNTLTTERDTIHLAEDDSIYMLIENKSETKAYISIFCVGAGGETTMITRAWEKGMEVSSVFGPQLIATKRLPLTGLPINWPKSVPIQEGVTETLMFVVTSQETDLRILETVPPEGDHVARGVDSASWSFPEAYNIIRIHYGLRPTKSLDA